MGTHIVDEFPLQEADRFQSQEVVEKERVLVFQSTDNAPKEEGRIVVNIRGIHTCYMVIFRTVRGYPELSSFDKILFVYILY